MNPHFPHVIVASKLFSGDVEISLVAGVKAKEHLLQKSLFIDESLERNGI